MEDDKRNKVETEISAEDLKKEQIIALYSYIDIVNRLLKIIIPVIGVEVCRKVLSEVALKHEILKDSEITDDRTLICPKAIGVISGEEEGAALAIIIPTFHMFIAKVKDIYNSMSSQELGVAALIFAATGAAKERLDLIERTKEELEGKIEERTRELEEKLRDLEMFKEVAVGRELKMIELKQEVDDLLEELGRSNRYGSSGGET